MGIIGAILGIIIFLFALAWTQGLFGDATSKLDEGTTFELVNRLRANVKESFFGQATYGASDTNLAPLLTGMGKVPASARGPTDTIVSPYGGAILVYGRGRRFHISVEDLDDEQCLKLGSRFAGAAGSQFGVLNIEVGTAADTSVNTAAPATVAVTAVDTACAGAGPVNHLTITFR